MRPFKRRQGWRNDSRGRGGGGGGARSWGPSRKMVPKCLKGPKTTYTTIANAEKQSKSSKKGQFPYTGIGSPGSHPGNGIKGARRGRSLPVPPVYPAMNAASPVSLVFTTFDSRSSRGGRFTPHPTPTPPRGRRGC